MKNITKEFTTATFALIPLAVALNLILGKVVEVLALPIFLDSIGTIIVGIVCGPWAGMVAGVITNVVGGLIVSPFFFPFTFVAIVIGLVAGLTANAGWFKVWWKVLLAGLVITAAVVLVATPTRMIVFNGMTPNSVGAFTALLVASGKDLFESVLTATVLSNVVDKVISAFVAYGILKGLPQRLILRFPRPENI